MTIEKRSLLAGGVFILLAALALGVLLWPRTYRAAPPPAPAELKTVPIPPASPAPQKFITDAPPTYIDKPKWEEQPSPGDLMDLYPKDALQKRRGGRVELDCLIAISGHLDCLVIIETPEGEGFAAAALKASALFKMAPTDKDGRPVAGKRLHLPMRFEPSRY
jgi:TonB family protein